MSNIIEQTKNIATSSATVKGIDWVAFFTAIGAFFTDWIPVLAGILSCIWLGIQIFLFIEKRFFGKGKGDPKPQSSD